MSQKTIEDFHFEIIEGLSARNLLYSDFNELDIYSYGFLDKNDIEHFFITKIQNNQLLIAIEIDSLKKYYEKEGFSDLNSKHWRIYQSTNDLFSYIDRYLM